VVNKDWLTCKSPDPNNPDETWLILPATMSSFVN